MSLYLKQSIGATIKLGPFVDQADGVTLETGLTLTSVVKLSKNGAAFAVRSSVSIPTYDADGYYAVALNATDTDTLGRLQVSAVTPAAHLPILQNYTVLAANIYDSLIGGGDLLEVDVQEVNSNALTADKLHATAPAIVQGIVQAGAIISGSQLQLPSNLTEATSDHYRGGTVFFTSGALVGQRLRITAYNGTTKVLSLANVTTDLPAAADTFYIA